MLVADVRTYVRSLCDEADVSYLTPDELTVMLQVAYNQFRRLVMKYDTSFYELTMDFTAPNSQNLSLNGTLLGAAAPAATRLEKIVRIMVLDAFPNGTPTSILPPAVSIEDLLNKRAAYGLVSWFLQNQILRFSAICSVPIQVQYVAQPNVDWSAGTYIDDLGEFHDIIALLAINKFKIKDVSQNLLQSQELSDRIQDLKRYLSDGRNGQASDYVTSTDTGYDSWFM